MADEEINEVRRIRHQISAECGHDIGRLVAHYKEVERELRASGKYRFVDAPPDRRFGSAAEAASAVDA